MSEQANEKAQAAEVIEQFAAPDSLDFVAFLDEFPTPSSRGNLRVILWRLAAHLRTTPSESS